MILRARQFEFRFPRPALLMGIVNVTPDSFSDGGQFFSVESAVQHALALIAEGADIIDVGGESTRPGANPVGEGEELRRVLPVIEQLAPRVRVPISIDTMKPAVAREALRVGASMVNDIAANRSDPAMWQAVVGTGAAYVAMHMQGTPQTMQKHPHYNDVVGEVEAFLRDRLQRLQVEGVALEQVILDPGIGFGKSARHNLELLAGLRVFAEIRRPLMLGVSRKSFIGSVTDGTEPASRLPGSLACTCWAVEHGVQIIRTHDVAATRQAVRMTETLIAAAREK